MVFKYCYLRDGGKKYPSFQNKRRIGPLGLTLVDSGLSFLSLFLQNKRMYSNR